MVVLQKFLYRCWLNLYCRFRGEMSSTWSAGQDAKEVFRVIDFGT